MKRIINTDKELIELARGLKLKEDKTFYLDDEKYRIIKEGGKENGIKNNIE